MKVSITQKWEGFVEAAVKDGRFASADDVVEESLRLLEERERKLQALREMIDASLAEHGGYTAEEVLAHVSETLEAHRRKKAAA